MNQAGSANRGSGAGPARKFRIWLPLAVLLALILAIAAGSYSRLAMRMPATTQAAQISAASAGTALNLMVEVAALPFPNQLNARLLDKQGANYVRTRQSVQLQLQADTRMMMGTRADLRPGAILEVRALREGQTAEQFRATSITVLTGYVRVH